MEKKENLTKKDLNTFTEYNNEIKVLQKKRNNSNKNKGKFNKIRENKETKGDIIILTESDDSCDEIENKKVVGKKNNKKKKKYDDPEKDNKHLIKLNSLEEYYNNRKQYYEDNKNNNKFDLEMFCETIDIIDECNFEYLLLLLKANNISKFYEYYSTHQFTLTLKQRINIQKLIKDFRDIPLMIQYNILNDSCTSLRVQLLNLCLSIINVSIISKNYSAIISDLKNCFINNNFYSNKYFEYVLPVKYGNYDFKISKLAIEILIYFFGLYIGEIEKITAEEQQIIVEKLI